MDNGRLELHNISNKVWTMNYNKISIATIAAGMFAAGSAFAQNAEIGTWAGFRKAATSFTFDDNAPNHVTHAAPAFDEYGYKATFNLVVNWNPDWSGFQKMADNGHEIASHSNTHGQNMSGEEASSKKSIEGKIKQKYGTITVAYPNCNVPGMDALKANYIAGRICGNGQEVMGKDGPSDWFRVPAHMTGSTGSFNNTNAFTGAMQQAIQKGGWVMFLTHGFSNAGNNGNANYSPTDLNAIKGALKWANQNDKDIWVAPMGFVAMYIKERKASKIEPQDGGAANTMTFELKHNIADNISKYDYPLSIKVKTDWSNVEVTQDGAALESKVDGGYVYFDAVPNAGKIVVKNAAAAPESSSSSEPESSSSETSSSSAGCVNPFDPGCQTGVAAAIPNNFQISVYRSSDNYIVVGGAQGQSITVFNSLGHKLRSTRGLGAEQKVYTGAKGMYIVKVGGRTWKVKL